MGICLWLSTKCQQHLGEGGALWASPSCSEFPPHLAAVRVETFAGLQDYMTNSKILLELKLIPAWRNAREAQASSSWGLPSMEARMGRGTRLAQTWLSLTRGCCCLLGPEFCLPGAAGEGAGAGTGGACIGFMVSPKLPSVG